MVCYMAIDNWYTYLFTRTEFIGCLLPENFPNSCQPGINLSTPYSHAAFCNGSSYHGLPPQGYLCRNPISLACDLPESRSWTDPRFP